MHISFYTNIDCLKKFMPSLTESYAIHHMVTLPVIGDTVTINISDDKEVDLQVISRTWVTSKIDKSPILSIELHRGLTTKNISELEEWIGR